MDCIVKAQVFQAMIGTLGLVSSGSTPNPNCNIFQNILIVINIPPTNE